MTGLSKGRGPVDTHSLSARAASVNAYDRWKAAKRHYEHALDAFRDERRLSETIARGHHLNLCILAAVTSARVETAGRDLATKLDRQDWFEKGQPAPPKISQLPRVTPRAPC